MTMLYEVVLQQGYASQILINRWNYIGSGTPAAISPSLALLNAMGFIPDGGVYPSGTIFSAIRSLQCAALNYIQCSARAIHDVEDFFETPFVQPLPGVATGVGMTPFNAFGLFTNRVRQDIGRGYKRLGGIVEEMVGSGGGVQTAALDILNPLAGFMSDVLTYDDSGNTLSFSPCIVKKEKYHPSTNPTGWAYKYPAVTVPYGDYVAQGILWTPYQFVRSQTSRQYGRGQ